MIPIVFLIFVFAVLIVQAFFINRMNKIRFAKEELAQKESEFKKKIANLESACKEDRKKLEEDRKKLDEDRSKLSKDISELSHEISKEKRYIEEQKLRLKEFNDICIRLEQANKELLVVETTVFEGDTITSEECKDKLSILRVEYKDFIKSGDAVIQIDSSLYEKSKKRFNDNVKQILRCFNAEASNILAAVSATNLEKQRSALVKSYETINTLFKTDGLQLNKILLEHRLKELNLIYKYQEKKAQEQEEQKAIRAQMIEEEKVRREIEREKIKLEKEEIQFKNEIDKLMKYLSKAGDDEVQKQLYVDKIKELEEKINLLEKDKENVLQREQNTRAGFVYIISNIGSFGEDVYKIGMTRRLEPMERIDELSSASVPFPFDVHAMIFSDDAPALETTLHNTFREHQVNLVNPRKEFYNVSLGEIEKVVKENYNATVTFTQIAAAEQYRESIKLKRDMVDKSI